MPLSPSHNSFFTINAHKPMPRFPIPQLAFTVLMFASVFAEAQTNYPVPPRTDKTLFYLQRTHNRNTIMYESNQLPSGNLNPDEPVAIHWIRYEEGGNRAELSFVQRRAFGLSFAPVKGNDDTYILKFNNLKSRIVFLLKNGEHYRAFTTINKESAEMLSVYIQSSTNSLGIPLSVEYVELRGISVKTKTLVTERFKP